MRIMKAGAGLPVLAALLFAVPLAGAEPVVADVTCSAFTVSWVSGDPAAEQPLRWGTAPDRLERAAFDVRGPGWRGPVRHVRVSGLAPESACYVAVPGHDTLLRVVTGPALAPVLPGQVYGPVLAADGRPAAGTLVVAVPRTGAGTAGAPLACLVGEEGWWTLNTANARTADLAGWLADRGGVARLEITAWPADGSPPQMFSVAPALARPAAPLRLP